MEILKLNLGICLFALFLICGQKVPQTHASNICTETRATGLFANVLCAHPITGELQSNSPRCKQAVSTMSCCCTTSSSCEDEPALQEGLIDIEDSIFADEINLDDYNNYDGSTYDYPDGRSDTLSTAVRQADIGDLNLDPSGFCPFGMKRCCYNENQVELNSVRRNCEPIKEMGQDFGLCQQGCEARLPKKMMTFVPSTPKSPPTAPIGDLFGRSGLIARSEIVPSGEKQCGMRQFDELDLPNSEVTPGEFPWTCSLWTVERGNEKYLGSCAIVPNDRGNDINAPTRRVITAAHKVKLDRISELKVRIEDANVGDPEGVADLIFQQNDEYDTYDYPNGRQSGVAKFRKDYTAIQIAQHPNFDPVRLSDNIAVLKLEQPIDLTNSNQVNAVCMPNCNDMFDNTFNNGTGARCWVAGWGNETDRMYQKKQDIPMYPDRASCERKLNNKLASLGYPGIDLHPGEICAGGELNKDACRGDGGTPLVCQAVSGHWHAVGLVSWGLGCGERDLPAVYVNVFHYMDFIYTSFNDRGAWQTLSDPRSSTVVRG